MINLVPCPICGKKAILHDDSIRCYVECLNCHRRTEGYVSPKDAIASWNEGATPSTDGSRDKRMNVQLAFCCGDMTQLLASGEIRLQRNQDGGLIATIGSFGHNIPLNYCPSCGRLFRLTFLADSGVNE